MKKKCDEVGPERVRQVLSDTLLSDSADDCQTGKVSDVSDAVASDRVPVASVRHPLEDEKTESGAPSWPGPYGGEEVSDKKEEFEWHEPRLSDPPADFKTEVCHHPRVKIFSRTNEERDAKRKALGEALGKVKGEEPTQGA